MAIGKGKITTWFEGKWQDGNTPIIGAADHVAWLGSQVFDGARSFEGVMPDLDLHCARLLRSAQALGMIPTISGEEIAALVRERVKKFPKGSELYIRPMMWSRDSGPGLIELDPDSTAFAICIEEMAMPSIEGFSLTVAPYRRPRQDMALTEAKAGSLYANNGRIMVYARQHGFSNALSLDIDGNVAETASTNVFLVRDGVVFTPAPTGCFLNGLTRQRVIGLLREDGIEVIETALTVEDFRAADEIFATGNIAKVMPVSRLDERELGIGPISLRARALYWDFAHSPVQSYSAA
ncbi:Branched-chain-amino-acid aminotransferase [Thalassovita gelatinovora]|uniref:Probable branched-chain-amino-acid aminotransferase n=1 Tax=Thalassovita gelatinovora TaxID=53501 RepID=A0A0P1FIY5_THAGE|nr:branched-chain amino acid aminotransferase [Thalassovita gelatinovora]QIZ82120.1 branched-chain amino acid aminotransferase [Thalassovita gelatinovora]CUH67686.1 Branched-chain-amino-acid aminotransferase [Thalassovita gelatinovora]SEP69365.1 branched-chain amino acid aminotransferase [Thalassovita gelatinovora]